MKIRLSEKIFGSFQGEAINAGMPSVWLRFFGCNLECNGFNQADPTNPETYILPYQTFDISNIKKMEELPVFEYGCDSSYSWSNRYKSLVNDYTEITAAEEIMRIARERFGATNGMYHPRTGQQIQLCFTGGEPMLQQKTMVEVTNALDALDVYNFYPISIETNGTVEIKQSFKEFIYFTNHPINIACSPKLFTVSGEKNKVNMDIISNYADNSDSGCIKVVINGTKECWDELDSYTDDFASLMDINPGWSLFVMPVGATVSQQTGISVATIANEAMLRGYNVATRNHVSVYGNVIGS